MPEDEPIQMDPQPPSEASEILHEIRELRYAAERSYKNGVEAGEALQDLARKGSMFCIVFATILVAYGIGRGSRDDG